MKKTKQILSVFLSVCMIISCMVGMTVTAGADEASESFATNVARGTYTGDHIKISGTSRMDADGDYLGTNFPWAIESLNGEIITKIVMTIGYYGGSGYTAYVASTKGTLSDVNDTDGGSFSFIDVNSTSAIISMTDKQFQIKAVTVYYTSAPTAYKINMSNGGKAYVNQQEVTEAAAGATVTVVAPQADPGTQFNGWTTTTAGVAFADPTASTTTFVMPASDATITASFEKISYNITMLNGAKAYVNQQEVTSAEANTEVTIVAPQPDPGTVFNGWTTTTLGVAFIDPTAPTTTFYMPESDVEITASFENILYSITVVNGTADKETAEAGQTVTVTADKRLGATFTGWTSEDVEFANPSAETTTFVMPDKAVTATANFKGEGTPYIKPVPAPSGGSATPSHSSSSSSDVSGTSASGQKLRAVLNSNNSLTVDWDKISGASKYILYYEKDGKDVKVIETKNNKVTIKTAKNNFTYKFKLKYITSGQTLDAPTGYTATLKSYYKPAVKLTQKDGKVTASWKKVPGADSYKVYKVVNGKLKFVTETTKNAVRFSAKSGSTVTYSVSAVVGGNETKLTKGDRVSIKVK